MTIGREYVSKLQSLTGLFIPQMINENGQPWQNDIKRAKLREKPVPVPLHPPQIPHTTDQGLHSERLASNHLN
jgi:hypothetical protein